MLNILKKLSFYVLLAGLVFIGIQAWAANNRLVVVYPKDGATIRANSTFFIGNTNPNAVMTVNGFPVKVYPSGAFVRVFSLNKGKNEINFVSKFNDEVITKKMTLYVPYAPPASRGSAAKLIPYNASVVVTEEEAPLRKTPYGDRLTPVKKGMVCQTEGILNNHYKVKYDGGYAYILKNFAKPADELVLANQVAQKVSFHEDKKHVYINVPLSQPVLAKVENKDNVLKVSLNNTKFAFNHIKEKIGDVKAFDYDENSFSVKMKSQKINGYDYYYDWGKFVLKIRKPFGNYIEGKVIVIDPGHGGKECGSIGPTEVPEKDINLKISEYLRDELIQAGAHVYMTREKDEYVDLYDRVEFAKKKNADILVSIHNNALPDGQNPYITHGTSTYYFQPQAVSLAQSIQKNLLLANGFNDLGVKYGSLVLTRPTTPVSVLVEVGFMINPFEYEALLNPVNQQKYAVGIKNGIVEYFKNFL